MFPAGPGRRAAAARPTQRPTKSARLMARGRERSVPDRGERSERPTAATDAVAQPEHHREARPSDAGTATDDGGDSKLLGGDASSSGLSTGWALASGPGHSTRTIGRLQAHRLTGRVNDQPRIHARASRRALVLRYDVRPPVRHDDNQAFVAEQLHCLAGGLPRYSERLDQLLLGWQRDIWAELPCHDPGAQPRGDLAIGRVGRVRLDLR